MELTEIGKALIWGEGPDAKRESEGARDHVVCSTGPFLFISLGRATNTP
jgi:hypothetical protein